MPRKGIVDITPDAEFWDDISMAHVWFTLWGRDFEEAPAYVRDPAIRKGIVMMLQLDRLAEEEERLNMEQNNLLQEYAYEFCTAHQAYHTTQEDHLCYSFRAKQHMEALLRDCGLYIKGKQQPDIALWRLPLNQVLEYAIGNNNISLLLRTVKEFNLSAHLAMDNDRESFGPTTSYMQCNLSRDVAADSDEEIFGPSSSYQVPSTLQLPNSAINVSNLNFMFTEVDPPSNGLFSVPSPLRIGSGTSLDSDNEASGSDDELEFEDEYADAEDHVAADALADMTKVLSMEPETMTRIVLPPLRMQQVIQ
ncbi:hypothetical protein M422DRAFT_275568, partial [Sphaerobolus stellatus SS14]